eukprot:131586_1
MNLVPYSDSDDDSAGSDEDEILEVTTKPITKQHFNFNAKPKSNQKNISLDLGTNTNQKSLFDSLPVPSPSSTKISLRHKDKKKKKRKKKKKKSTKKRKREPSQDTSNSQNSLISILPEPVHKKRKMSSPSLPSINDDVEVNSLRKDQAETQRKHKNPLATFSILSADSTNNDKEIEQASDTKHKSEIVKPVKVNNDVLDNNTASAMYKVDDNNNYLVTQDVQEEHVDYSDYSHTKQGVDKQEDDEIITISQSRDLLHNENGQKPWLPTFEMDDITREDIKIIPTNSFNPETGKVERVKKYTKIQRRKHQINTLAIEAQEKALQLAMRRSSSYKTKAETQAKYGW